MSSRPWNDLRSNEPDNAVRYAERDENCDSRIAEEVL